jgi:hypothetical protein
LDSVDFSDAGGGDVIVLGDIEAGIELMLPPPWWRRVVVRSGDDCGVDPRPGCGARVLAGGVAGSREAK